MKDLILSLYGKLDDWNINPIILAKAVGIFLILVMLVVLMVTFPVLFGILLIVAICIAIIALIYIMLEQINKGLY